MNQDIINEILANEEYVRNLVALGNLEDAVKQLNADGYEVTAEDVEQFLKQTRVPSDGELSDDDLENVAGGFIIDGIASYVSA